MTVFCFVCKRHVDLGEVVTDEQRQDALRRFRACGHDDRKVSKLRHGPVGFYSRDLEQNAPVVIAADVAECFENHEHIDPERIAA